MSIKHIKYTARIFLLLYLGYFGCVSYFVHKHVYQGVVYIHSHPYKTNPTNDNEPPFETHKHTAAGFFTLNQLSNYSSFEGNNDGYIGRIETPITIQYVENYIAITDKHEVVLFRHRAPPIA